GKDRPAAARASAGKDQLAAPAERTTLAGPPQREGSSAAWAAAGGALAAAGLLAVSLTFWNWATQAKMYSLHFAFMAGLLWLALRTRRALYADAANNAPPARRWPPVAWPPAIRLLHLLALLAGLSMTNHYLNLVLWVGLAILLLAPIGRARTPWTRIFRHAGTVVAAGLLPLLLY